MRDSVVGKVTVVSSEGDTSVFLVKLKHHSDETQSQWHLILGTPGEFEVVPIDEQAKEMVDGRESGDAP